MCVKKNWICDSVVAISKSEEFGIHRFWDAVWKLPYSILYKTFQLVAIYISTLHILLVRFASVFWRNSLLKILMLTKMGAVHICVYVFISAFLCVNYVRMKTIMWFWHLSNWVILSQTNSIKFEIKVHSSCWKHFWNLFSFHIW